ncbi:hypothetical protein CPT_Scapp_044 [Serratia phage Scapp]|uniref:HNH endonuclease n=1 Tax=Serratia phage Scapp TaxID=2282409 RepID=A0A345L6S1_9CAUD|nr:endonuclease VII [Serratia phage Scapp]AXH50973.1 hypothetical protein CPT_Scapp_044 [Serratia phage Scapp]
MSTKQCRECGEEKPLDEFNIAYTRSKDGYRNICKVCQREQDRIWRNNKRAAERAKRVKK